MEGPLTDFLKDSIPGHGSLISALVCKFVRSHIHTCSQAQVRTHTGHQVTPSSVCRFLYPPTGEMHTCSFTVKHALCCRSPCARPSIHMPNVHRWNFAVGTTPVFCAHGHPCACTPPLTHTYLESPSTWHMHSGPTLRHTRAHSKTLAPAPAPGLLTH